MCFQKCAIPVMLEGVKSAGAEDVLETLPQLHQEDSCTDVNIARDEVEEEGYALDRCHVPFDLSAFSVVLFLTSLMLLLVIAN